MPNEQLPQDRLPPSRDELIDGLPDLVMVVRRDGVILNHGGGRRLPGLKLDRESIGLRLDQLWPQTVSELILRLTRRAIALRSSTEAKFADDGRHYEARFDAHGPDRALCIIRCAPADAPDAALDITGERLRPQLDRRGFLRRFKDAASLATLREKPTAVAVIQIDGVAGIAQSIDAKFAEQLVNTAILRLPTEFAGAQGEQADCIVGQIGDTLLALVLETSDHDVIEAAVLKICQSLREPITIGDADFHLTPYAGAAVLGQDANSANVLLDNARAAASQAQRRGSAGVCFFTDTLKLRSLARLDIARELRAAIENRDICLRYAGRHDLATGRLECWLGYLRWIHPARGEVRPVEFLRVAETTGLVTELSRTILRCLQEDFTALSPQWDADVRISFGALRHHVLQEGFAADIVRFLGSGAVPAQRLELRIAEQTLVERDPSSLEELRRLGVRLVVDEAGRGLASLDGLARAPLWGLQLDRSWVTAARRNEVALKVCRAGISLATALGLVPIAAGIDDQEQRRQLLAFGCRHGSGDIFQTAVPDMMKPYRAAVSD